MSPTPEVPPDAARGATAKRRRRGTAADSPQSTAAGAAADTAEGDPLVALVRNLLQSAGPSFGMSLIIHVVLLFALALIVVRQPRQTSFPTSLTAFNPSGREGGGEVKQPRKAVQFEEPAAEVIEIPGRAPAAEATTDKPETPAAPQVSRPSEVNVAGALGARLAGGGGGSVGGGDGTGTGGSPGGAGGRGALLAAQGGTSQTEQAVSSGLAWLARQQKSDGHWELHQGYPDAGQLRTSSGATALALLTFLGAGHTHRDGAYKDKVARGLKWLQNVQKKTGPLKGDFYDLDREGDTASFYTHGQATMVFCEAYALTQDADLLPALQDGLNFICEAQHPKTGGWKYRRHAEGDLSVFGWQIMALQSARMAGLEVPGPVLDRATRFLDLVQEQDGARYRYEPNELKSFTPAMTAEGLLCRQYLGWPRDHPAMRDGVRYLLEDENLPDWDSGRRNIYHWYYAAQVLHNLQGRDWEKFNAVLRDELVQNQVKGGGKVGGSWNPFQPAGAADENADKGGRLYVTCLCLLTLEVYYRHLPLYRETP